MNGTSVRALVVEDDHIFCEFLTELLKGKGFEVTATTDGMRGFELSMHERYDLFVIDVRMPLVLGTELAQALKQDRPAAKIILISGFADASLRSAAANLGVALLSKPFLATQFFEAVERTVTGRA